MMTESDIRKLLAKAAPINFRQVHLDHLHRHIDARFKDFNKRVFEELAREPVELYDIDEIAGPIERRADAEGVCGSDVKSAAAMYCSIFSVDRTQIIKEQIDAFLARDPAP